MRGYESITNYFKGEREMFEFILLYTDGKKRSELLGVTFSCYSKKKIREDWYKNILSKISDERAIAKLEQIYNEMC